MIQQGYKTIFVPLWSWIIIEHTTEKSGLGVEHPDTWMFTSSFGGHFKDNIVCVCACI